MKAKVDNIFSFIFIVIMKKFLFVHMYLKYFVNHAEWKLFEALELFIFTFETFAAGVGVFSLFFFAFQRRRGYSGNSAILIIPQ